MENWREQLKACGVDVEGALNRMMDNESLFLRMMKKFLDDSNYSQLMDNIGKGDYEEAFKNAHTIKGVAGNLGLNPIMEADAALVEKLRKHDTQDLLEDMSRLTREYETICAVLREL